MGIFEKIKNFLTGRVSDEEFEELIKDSIKCPYCDTYIEKDMLYDNNWVCPRCHKKIEQDEK